MKINFNELAVNEIANFKNGEGVFRVRWHVDELNRIMNGHLEPGSSIGEHTHTDSSEIMFFTAGEGVATIDGREEHVRAGDCHYCPKGSRHTLRSVGTEALEFLAVVPNQ